MDFELSEEQKMVQEMVRDFAQKKIAPIAPEIDQQDKFPTEIIQEMAGLGLLGIPFPEEFGGSGDNLSYVLAIEELAKVSSAVAITVSVHTSLAADSIYVFGSEQQKEKFFIPLAQGKKIGAFGLTEPNAGSDVASIEALAVPGKGRYLLNGTKIFITNGGVAETYVIIAVTDKGEKDIRKRLSAFILEKGAKGFSFGEKYDKMGWRGSETMELIFEDVKVPKENLLGLEGQGFIQAMKALDAGRIGVAAIGLGLAEGALEASLKFAKERRQFGRPIADFQAIQFMMANIATEIEAARYLVWRAAQLKEAGKPYQKEAAMAKLFTSELAMRAATKAVQIYGGSGYIKGSPVERFFRDAKILEIGEGTSEIQRLIIARSLLK